ncbi:MAG: pyrroloquinoline quinone biosynthesis protein PqqB [Candidatus Aminicenantes bacterium]|nr:pyrroloquinoline quinone biosynthesis protein PqqB [Candidatus Aminicenantes bacterium]
MERREFFNACLGGLAGMNIFFTSGKRTFSIKDLKKEKEETDVLVKVLGTAQDGGLPQIGCYCKNCLRAREDQRFSRLISSLAIIDLGEKKYFILDATPDIRIQADIAFSRLALLKQGRKNFPDGILLTHAHIGHYTGLMFYGYESMSAHKLPVYCSSRMKSFLSSNGPWSQLVSLENISIHTLSMEKEFLLTPRISFTPFLVPHRNEYTDTLGFIISGDKRKLLYVPDIQSWEAWSRSIVKETRKSDVALLDGTFCSSEELPGRDLSKIGHPFIKTSLKTLKNVAEEGKTKIYFTHLNHSNLALDPEGEARKEVEEKGFGIASEGMEFFL